MSISHRRRELLRRGRNRKPRSKTFTSEEAAKAWAESQNMTNFTVRKMFTSGKFVLSS